MRSTQMLLAAALTLVAIGQVARAQQPGYPAAPGYQVASGYAYLPGGASPAGYLAPGGYPVAPAGGMPVSFPQAGAAPSPKGDSSGGAPECDDQTCHVEGWQFYGDYLYLRPRNAEISFAVPFDGDFGPAPIGPTVMLSPGYHSGYRAGFSKAIDCWASLGASYTRFDSETISSTVVDLPTALHALVMHPSAGQPPFVDDSYAVAAGEYNLNFQVADLDYRCTFACGSQWSADYVIGARYARLDQDAVMAFNPFDSTAWEVVGTSVDFEGAGPKLGIEAERHGANTGFMVFGRGAASFLVGDFAARYQQWEAFGGEYANNSWKSGRIVPILELELGVGWASPRGALRFTAGYLVSAWFNTVTTADYIYAVQHQDNNYRGLGNTITFDGLTARAEVRF